jgi:hypothetical protein
MEFNQIIGLNKMIENHLNKLFVTNDAATILKELDVFHPAAKLVLLASQMQEQEVRYARRNTNIVDQSMKLHGSAILRNTIHNKICPIDLITCI